MRLPFFYGWTIVAVTFVTMGIGGNARTSFSLFLPPIIDEFGWERGVTAGAFSFGFLVSAILRYTGQSLFLPNWFIRRRGLATGLAVAGVGIGSVILLPWVQRIIEQAGWRTACWTLGLLISGQALRQHLRHHHADLPRRGRRRSLGYWRSARPVRQLYRGIVIGIGVSLVSAATIWLASPGKERAVAGRLHLVPSAVADPRQGTAS
jgi:hypothetical protein